MARAGRLEEAQTDAGTLLYLSLGERGGIPLVHGLMEGREGDYSALTEAGGVVRAVRDAAGTRPLYVGEDGSAVASDFRFLGSDAKLLPPGAEYAVAERTLTETNRPPSTFGGEFDDAADTLAAAIQRAVDRRTRGLDRVAVAFSGGLDSSVVAACAARRAKVLAISVFAPGSRDEREAEQAAGSLGVGFAAVRLERSGAARELAAMDLPFRPDGMDRGLWCIYSAAARAAASAGAGSILLGQLADELFGGYAKYERAAAESPGEAEAMMARDLKACGERGLIRDEQACARWLEPGFPLATAEVLSLAAALPIEFKIRGGERKRVLREAARRLGVPEELASAPKKAAQYSSGLVKLVGGQEPL